MNLLNIFNYFASTDIFVGIITIYVLYLIIVTIILVLDNKNSTSTLIWVLIIYLLPVLGLLLYFMLGRRWVRYSRKIDFINDKFKEEATNFINTINKERSHNKEIIDKYNTYDIKKH